MRTRNLLVTVLTILLSSAGPIVGQLTLPIVDLGYARYEGKVNPTTQNTEFLGVRYAASPEGPLRWKAPQPPQPTNDLQLANKHPNICHQLQLTASADDSGPTQSEDCLFLNVYSPGPVILHKRLPVVVWIHGGGLLFGSASAPGFGLDFNGVYDGNDLIAQSGNKVVVVSIQYRLGILGFLSGSQIKKNGVVNAGFLDQQFAFKWIQNHISKFGGDPKKVTIWGESAGATSVLQHLIANGGNTQPPLFRGAMLSSTALTPQYPFDHPIPESRFTRALDVTGCSTSPNPVECMRAVDVSALLLANTKISTEVASGSAPFSPVVDGQFFRERPNQALQKGKVNTKHLLLIRNSNEGLIFVDPATLLTIENAISRRFPTLSASEVARGASLYNTSGSLFEQVVKVHEDAMFVCPVYAIASGLNGQVYQAQFAIPPALHADDVRYYFPSSVPATPPFNNTQFINTFSQSFMDFVLEQDPNKKHDRTNILPHWPKWSRSSPLEMVFNKTGDAPNIAIAVTSISIKERCQFWASVSSSAFQ